MPQGLRQFHLQGCKHCCCHRVVDHTKGRNWRVRKTELLHQFDFDRGTFMLLLERVGCLQLAAAAAGYPYKCETTLKTENAAAYSVHSCILKLATARCVPRKRDYDTACARQECLAFHVSWALYAPGTCHKPRKYATYQEVTLFFLYALHRFNLVLFPHPERIPNEPRRTTQP